MSLTPFEIMIVTELLETSREFEELSKLYQEQDRELPTSFVDASLQPWVQCFNSSHDHPAPIPGPFYTAVISLDGVQFARSDKCAMRGDIIRNYGEYGKNAGKY